MSWEEGGKPNWSLTTYNHHGVKCHHCTNTLWPHRAATRQNNALLPRMNQRTAGTYKHFSGVVWLVGRGNSSRTGRKAEPLLSDRFVSHCDKVTCEFEVHNHTHYPRYTKTSSKLTHRVYRWRLCSFLRLSSQWRLRMFASPSDAWPAWTWPSDYLKHTHLHPAFTQSHLTCTLLLTGNRRQPRGAAYQWSFLRWRTEWLPRAISFQLGMWLLEEYDSS